jgi:hypothetical protein
MSAPPLPQWPKGKQLNALLRSIGANNKPKTNKAVKRARNAQPRARRGKSQAPGARLQRAGRPRMNRSSQFPTGKASTRGARSTIISEDEYIADVNGSTGFATTSFAYNIGQKASFPWAYAEAALWQKHTTLSAEYYYKPEVSAYATNGQSGKVMLSFQYNAALPPPANKTAVEDTQPHADAMPYESVRLPLNPSQLNTGSTGKFIRYGPLPGGNDIHNYDGGNLFISTYGNTNTTVIGELRVRYTIRLDDKIIPNSVSAPINNQVAQFATTASEASGATGVYTPLLLASAITNGISAVNTAGSIVLPVGNYFIEYNANALNASGDMTNFNIDIWKNGNTTASSVFPYSASLNGGAAISGTAYNASLSCSSFVTSNGTDVFKFVSLDDYTGGVQTNYGSVTIIAQ